ncbi:MAG: Do family serine endopeptidase [Pseudomonadota bacterium]
MQNSFFKVLGVFLILGLQSGFTFSQALPDFTVLVEKNAPAIVNVSTTLPAKPIAGQDRENLDELLRYFYGDGAPQLELPEPGPNSEPSSATGSGFIISDDGFIVTNHHVIDGAESITVTLNDQRAYKAVVVGSDERSDLAVLKIEASSLPVVTLGDSSKLKVGEWVLAIGSPFGLQYSVAAGIISYMGRSLPSQGTNYVSFIQTDVAINPGHSGGPLFNLAGEVIGINSQIFTSNGGSIGLSFAIPVDVAKNVVAQLRQNGSVSRGWMGVGIEDVSPELAEAFNLVTPHGALVDRIIEGGPAEQAGLQSGDIIVEFNGQVIRTSADLPYFVGLVMPGTEVSMEIVRATQSQTLSMTVGSLTEAPSLAAESPEATTNRLGLVVSKIDNPIMQALEIEHGVLVEKVEGIAANAGLMPGDVIVSLNNVDIFTAEDLERTANELPVNKALPILVAREQQLSYMTIRIPE